MQKELYSLRIEIENCRKCPLAETRRHAIFGEGHSEAPVMVIGEAPGRDEDRIGRPFVGRSGQLLDKILAACSFNRQEHVFISNIVKCRPPENRAPSPREAAVCMPWLQQQIECINPKIIILLGATALKYMAGSEYKITRDRGKWILLQQRMTMPVYHPSALLRNPNLKRDTWEDFQKIFHKYRELVDPAHTSKHIPIQ
jgi:DNA polymerase